MTATIPKEYLDIFEKNAFAIISTLMPDGTPHQTPVWIEYDGKHLVVNTSRGRIKEKNMSERKNVALTIQDPDNPYRYVSVRGEVVEITENGADDQLDKLAMKYLGEEKYPWKSPGEIRVQVRIKPQKVMVLG